jgi:hypothetical protein
MARGYRAPSRERKKQSGSQSAPSCHFPVSLIPVVGATAVVGTATVVETATVVASSIISSVAVVTMPIGGGSGDRTGGSQGTERNARTIVAVVATTIITDINYRRWSRIIDSCCTTLLYKTDAADEL